MNGKKYVVGFLFTDDAAQVLLIKKNRPEWQVSKINGIGGHIEEGETPAAAMSREFFEEAGVLIKTWEEVLILGGVDWKVYFFRAFSTEKFNEAKSATDEEIFRAIVAGLPTNVISNLNWIVPFCLSDYEFPIKIKEK